MVAANCHALTSLEIAWCRNITGEAVKTIAGNYPTPIAHVTQRPGSCINLSINLTDEAINAVATNCPSLASLTVWDCEKTSRKM